MVSGENTHASSPIWRVPATFNPLLGREREVVAIGTFLTQTEARLLTLLGAPGIGKTRLSLEVAQALRSCFADGVCFVELAALRDPGLMVPTLARELGIGEDGPQPLAEQVKKTLGDKHLLLMLDNFEHLLAAASEVEELLVACPSLKIVVTSRSALRVQAEYLFPVAPLALPDLSRSPELETLARTASVALFVQRAQAIRPDFQLTSANARAIAEICVRLDGLPLAIELAAARVSVLSAQDLLARLSSRLGLLTRGAWSLPERHQTLRQAIGWSYDLLPSEEQRLFRCLSVFAGGCTLKAVEAVWAALGGEHAAGQVLDAVASLIDKSLLQRIEHEGQEPRFVMLETIREYAQECLERCGEAERFRQAHADYYVNLMEEAERTMRTSEQVHWYLRLRAEMDNLRAVLHWSIEMRELEAASRLSRAMWYYWMTGGLVREGWHWVEQVLPLCTTAAASVRAKVLLSAAALAFYLGRYEQSTAFAQECLALYRALDDAASMAGILLGLATIAFIQGDYEQVRSYCEEVLPLLRALGDQWNMAHALFTLAAEAHARGESSRAHIFAEESLALSSASGDRLSAIHPSVLLAQLAFDHADYPTARSWYERCLLMLREVDAQWYVAPCLQGLGAVVASQGHLEWAAQLWGAAEAFQETIFVLIAAIVRPVYERAVARVRAQLDEAVFTAAWAKGRTMTPEQVLAQEGVALPSQSTVPERSQVQPLPTLAESPGYPAGLTEREVQVLRLVAQGLTNTQIAERLVLSHHTVNNHVRSILSKLDVASRSGATRFAIEHKLL
ncbi:MAG TPA: LuxR C-terminal-related transcriptional regulator [Ktedonobacteraceae bacterium]